MAQNYWTAPTPPTQPPPSAIPPQQARRRGGWSWLSILLIGIVLFIVATVILFATGNPNLYPTVILIGNFLIPITFVAFLYDYQHLSTLTPETIARSFGIGGILGVLGASVLESLLIRTPALPNQGLSLGSALLVGLIEEGCKIAAVMFMVRRKPHTTMIDGLLLGAAVGMGFAALESTGYAFTALLSQGHLSASIVSTVLRGVFAPFGHGVWTGILGAVLFRESGPRHFRIDGLVILAYLFVSVLHGFWDGLPVAVGLYLIVPPGVPISIVTIILAIVGVVVLTILYRRALRQRLNQVLPPNEAVQAAQAFMPGQVFQTNQPYPPNQPYSSNQPYPPNQEIPQDQVYPPNQGYPPDNRGY